MARRQSLPLLWLLSDARNDARLEAALARLPAGSGFVFRHYHLDDSPRQARFMQLAGIARASGHLLVMSGTPAQAREWGADGVYGCADRLGEPDGLVRLATAHDGDEIRSAVAAHADAVFLSPVFPSRSHPGARALGVHGFSVLAQQASVPVIALGGMNPARARELDWPRWGAIDGLS